MKVFLTGRPGVGKSVVLMKTIELLKGNGLKIGGFVTPEIIEEDKRVGFYVKDIFTGEVGILASKDIKIGHSFGRYGINVEDFERIALKALDFAIENCNIIAIDEIGKMEFFSQRFREKITELLLVDKPLIAVLHRSFVDKVKEFGKVVEVTAKNRDELPLQLIQDFV